jgi:hypothetical protein
MGSDSTKGELSALKNKISPKKGAKGGGVADVNPGNQQLAPWGSDLGTDAFFKSFTIDPDRWTKVYPYRLMVIDITTNKLVASNKTSTNSPPKVYFFENGSSATLSTIGNASQWLFILPLTPQQISIIDQYAINTIPTMRGIVEYHNGVKFKMINIAGTTGLWPTKPSGINLDSPSILQSIFGGWIEKKQQLSSAAKSVKGLWAEKTKKSATKATPTKANPKQENETGYYQALLLDQFIERYVKEKKKPENKNWRLVFDMPKENQSFVVTPIGFTRGKNQTKPLETQFTIQLKAWKRIDLNIPQQDLATTNDHEAKLNTYQKILKTIRNTRQTLAASKNLILAAKSDALGPLEALRQTALAIKDAIGVATTLADAASDVVNSYKNSVKDTIAATGLKKSNSGASSGSAIASKTSSTNTATTQEAISSEQATFEGMPSGLVASGALGDDMAQTQNASDTNNVFDNPEENFDFFDGISMDQMSLTTEQRELFNNEIERVRLLTIDDFRTFRKDLVDLALAVSDNFGASDSTYAYIYRKTAPKTRDLEITIEENEVLLALWEATQAYDDLLATKAWDDRKVSNPLEYIGGLANQVGVTFENFSSKYLVPVPHGLNIEQIAARYMGNPDKWIEIATVNNLRSPYIDEDGFSYDLASNAEGRQFTVDDSESQIFIGQQITLQSDTVPMFVRNVTNVEKISDTNFLVTVDGLADLDTLTTADNAKMRGYLPGTVNSQNQIYLPTNDATDTDDRTFEIPTLDQPYLTKISKIDWMLDDSGDVVLDSVGDFRLANGLNNLVQALKLKIKTQKGTLLRHLDYGLGITHGMSVADLENGEIIKSMNKMIENDDRFDSISRIDLTLNAPNLKIDMAVNLANQKGIVPISFDMRL